MFKGAKNKTQHPNVVENRGGLSEWAYNETTGGIETYIQTEPGIPILGYTFATVWIDPDYQAKAAAWSVARDKGEQLPWPLLMCALLRFSPGIDLDDTKLLVKVSHPEIIQWSFLHKFQFEQMDDGSTRIACGDEHEVGKLMKILEMGKSFTLTIYQGEGRTLSEMTQMFEYKFPDRDGFKAAYKDLTSIFPNQSSRAA